MDKVILSKDGIDISYEIYEDKILVSDGGGTKTYYLELITNDIVKGYERFKGGRSYYMELPRKYFTGRYVGRDETHVYFDQVCWIPETGSFNEYFKTYMPQENEPIAPHLIVSILINCITISVEVESPSSMVIG